MTLLVLCHNWFIVVYVNISGRVNEQAVYLWFFYSKSPWLLTVDFEGSYSYLFCCNILTFRLVGFYEILIWPSNPHLFESILGTKLWIFNLASVTIICYASLIDILLIYTYPSSCSFWLNTLNKSIYVIGHVFLIYFIDLNVLDNSQDYICQVHYLFFSHYFDYHH